MLRTLDRYLIREIVPPFALALLVFTFILQMDPVARIAQPLLSKGASITIVAKALAMLLPQALALTIPMAFLLGLLVAFGRLSGDSEWVAMQACGVSLTRMLRPVFALAIVAWAATQWVLLVAVPWCNQGFREIEYQLVTERAETEIKPRVFFQSYRSLVLYVRDMRQGVPGWTDVFVADTSRPGPPIVFMARHGRLVLDKSKRTVEMLLENGIEHRLTSDNQGKEKYEANRFNSISIRQNPDNFFPDAIPQKGEREMTVAELRQRAAELRKDGLSPHNPIWYIHQKFSIPVACFVFALIGLSFGVSTIKGGKLAAFTVGLAVIFVYYVLLLVSQSLVKGHHLAAELGPWTPDILLGAFGIVALALRTRLGGRSFTFTIPERWLARFRRTPREDEPGATRKGRPVLVVRLPRIGLPHPQILDRYVSRMYLRILALTFASLLGISYISSFINLSEKLFKGKASLRLLFEYMWYSTPQFVYYVIPIAVLLATLVTIGLLTRNSELIVMRACGISLYRVTLPLVVFGVLASGVLFALEESVLADANQRADELNQEIRTGTVRTLDVLNRRWVVGRDGRIYHYEYFEPRRKELTQLSIYQFDPKGWSLARRTYLSSATFDKASPANGQRADGWISRQGWVRELDTTGAVQSYVTFNGRRMPLEQPDYFGTEQPEADRLTYTNLRRYIASMRAAGFNVVPFLVQLHQKLSFPVVTIIMTLIAVPFAVSTGRRGALYGIGVGIALAMVYWTANSVFGAVGTAGLLSPVVAAWAPNLLFGAGALYLLLTVRT